MRKPHFDKRQARDRYEHDMPSMQQQYSDDRESNPDPCLRSRYGRHRFQNGLKNASGRLICDFCHQERILVR